MQEIQFQFLGWEDPLLGRKWQPTPVFFPGKSQGQWSLAGYIPWVTRVRHDLVTKSPACKRMGKYLEYMKNNYNHMEL